MAKLHVDFKSQISNLKSVTEIVADWCGRSLTSKTTIEELYAWEFNGPFLEDFTGHQRPVDGGCAGALGEVGLNVDRSMPTGFQKPPKE